MSSNLSDIGFNVDTEEDFERLLQTAFDLSTPYRTKEGTYFLYTDKSGAELWIQFDKENHCIGANPHYSGKSRRKVGLTEIVERQSTILDGAFYCWAEPSKENDPDSGEYPFVFDVPDFRMIGPIEFPKDCEIQLTAFAQHISIFDSEKEYEEVVTEEVKYATQSFVPTGLFVDGTEGSKASPLAQGFFTGTIKEFAKRQNVLMGGEFYWLLVDTLGGEIDIVADMEFFEKEPLKNGVIQGLFWLSGRLIDPPKNNGESKGFFRKLFG